jgi:hypothetical protein
MVAEISCTSDSSSGSGALAQPAARITSKLNQMPVIRWQTVEAEIIRILSSGTQAGKKFLFTSIPSVT